jgi:MFS-type transporter involved in bile tolerance (Atg22 family)
VQSLYLITIIALAIALGFSDDDVKTAQFSQAVNTVWVAIGFWVGWRRLPTVPAVQKLPAGRTLVGQGFRQVNRTIVKLNRDFKKGLRWYFLGLVFAQAAVNSFTVVSVVYLDEHLGLSGTEIAIFFVVTLIASLPGARMGAWITHKINPSRSYRLVMLCLIVVTMIGSVLADVTNKYVAYGWAVATGVLLGWFYPVEGLYFSMALPKSQETEFSGFYVYSTQILGWAPPLLFAGLVELDISQTYGVWSIALFLVIAIGILSCAAPWSEILVESKLNGVSNTSKDADESVSSVEDVTKIEKA